MKSNVVHICLSICSGTNILKWQGSQQISSKKGQGKQEKNALSQVQGSVLSQIINETENCVFRGAWVEWRSGGIFKEERTTFD